MSSRQRTKGVVLQISSFREKDKIITFYTKEFGQLEILGKSIRKKQAKLRSFVQFPYFSEIDFIQGKNHKILTDAILINNFSNIRKNLKRVTLAYKIAYTMNSLINNPEKDEKIWQLLLSVFYFLDKERFSESKCAYLYNYFLWNLLVLLGYKINYSQKTDFSHIFKLFEEKNINIINRLDEKWQRPMNQFICQKIKK